MLFPVSRKCVRQQEMFPSKTSKKVHSSPTGATNRKMSHHRRICIFLAFLFFFSLFLLFWKSRRLSLLSLDDEIDLLFEFKGPPQKSAALTALPPNHVAKWHTPPILFLLLLLLLLLYLSSNSSSS
jgi:hypothetical protein